MIKPITVLTCVVMLSNLFAFKTVQPFECYTIEERAELANMTVDDFIFISSVVEAESDRSNSLNGRVLIALTILNRVNSPTFPNTISEVLTQSGQFSTVRNGQSVTERTELSDKAVILAVDWLNEGDAPEVLFFNCRGFFPGREPYELVDGNYFSL